MTPETEAPIIRIGYAWLLDGILLPSLQKNNPDWTPPEREEVLTRIDKRKELWVAEEGLILKGLSDITGLKFYQNVIDVYFVTEHRGALSTPLIIGSNAPLERCNDMLTHELIHRLLNDNIAKLNLRQIQTEMFPEIEDPLTRNHILVHAIHKALYLDVFKSEERLTRELEVSRNFPGYKESWEIVDQRGYQELIANFKKFY